MNKFYYGIAIGILVFAASLELSAQEWNYARLALIYGGDIPFNFNSVRTISEGIEIQEGTILGITLVDSAQAGHTLTGFNLQMRAFNGATEISGEVHSLDLNRIQIRADNYLGFGAGFTTNNYLDLSAAWTTLCSYTDPDLVFDNLDWDSHQISVSYQCGMPVAADGTGSLLGEAADAYRIEIEIELVPTGPGF